MPQSNLEKLISAVATLTDATNEMQHKIDGLTKEVAQTREIVEAWAAVKTAGKFLRWIGGIGGGIVAIYFGIKFGAKLMVMHMVGK